MAKRPYEYDESERQLKKVVTESMVNENDPTLMNKIYEKTNEALYNGSKMAFNQTAAPQECVDEMDMEMEEYFNEDTLDKLSTMTHNGIYSEDAMAREKYGYLSKSEVNRFIQLHQRSPSPFPREPIPGKCTCTETYTGNNNSGQLCLRHMWGFSVNINEPSVSHNQPTPTEIGYVHEQPDEIERAKMREYILNRFFESTSDMQMS